MMKSISLKKKLLLVLSLLFVMTACFGLSGLFSTKVSATNSLDTAASSFKMEGQAVRLATDVKEQGMRFVATLSLDDYDNLCGEDSEYKSVEFGYFIMPKYYETYIGEINEDNTFGAQAKYTWEGKEEATGTYAVIHYSGVTAVKDKLTPNSEEKYLVKGSVIGINAQNLATKYTARMYIKAVSEGETSDSADDVIEYKFASAPANNFSMIDVAIQAMDDNPALTQLESYITTYEDWYQTQNDVKPTYSYTINYYVGETLLTEKSEKIDGVSINTEVDISTTVQAPDGYKLDSANAKNNLSGKVYADNNLVLSVYLKNIKAINGTLNNKELFYFEKEADLENYSIVLPEKVGSIDTLKIGSTAIADFSYDDENMTITIAKSLVESIACGDYVMTIENATDYYSANVTITDVIINNEEELYAMFNYVAENDYNSKYAILGNDINCTGSYIRNGSIHYSNVFDGKGYAVKNFVLDSSGIFTTLQSGAIFKNVAFLNVVNNKTSGLFAADAANFKFDNVVVTYAKTSGGGFVNFTTGASGISITNSVIVMENVGTGNFIANNYNVLRAHDFTNLYAITERNAFPSENADDTLGIYADAQTHKVASNVNAWLNTLNKTLPEGLSSNYWSFDNNGNLMFGDEAVLKYTETLEGTKNGGELFFFSKDVSVVTGYKGLNTADDYYVIELPGKANITSINSITIGGVSVTDYNLSGTTLKIAIDNLENVAVGEVKILIDAHKLFVANATVADFVISTANDLKAILPVVDYKSSYVVIGNDINGVTAYSHTLADANAFTGTIDGKGYAIKNIEISGHAFLSMLGSGGTLKNLAIINATHTYPGTALLLNQNRGTVENVFISGTTTGARAIINSNYTTIKNVIAFVNGVTNSYLSNNLVNSASGTSCADNIYAISNYTGGISQTATNSATYADANALLTAFNGTKPTAFGNYWSFDTNKNLCFGGNVVAKYTVTLKGEKTGGELFFFSKDVNTATSYASAYVSNGYYNVVLPEDVGTVNAVSIANKNIEGFTYSDKVLSIPVGQVSSLSNGVVTMIIDSALKAYETTVTIANQVVYDTVDFISVLNNKNTIGSSGNSALIVLDRNITWDNSKTFPAGWGYNLYGELDGKGYVVKNLKTTAYLFQSIQSGGAVRNIAFLNVTYQGTNGLLCYQAGAITIENVAVTYSAGTSIGLVGQMTQNLSIIDTIVVCNPDSYAYIGSYTTSKTLTLENSYCITTTASIKTEVSGDSTIYPAAQSTVCANIATLKTASNNLKDFGSPWAIDKTGNITFGGEIVVAVS